MLKSLILKQKRDGLKATLKSLADKDQLTAEERELWTKTFSEVEALDKEISLEEQRETVVRANAAAAGQNISQKEERTLSQYSFVKAIQDVLEFGKPQGLEGEMHQEAVAEMKAIGKSVTGFGVPSRILRPGQHQRSDITTGTAPLVQTNIVGFIDALYAKTMCIQMGAEALSGLTGPISIPRVATKASVGWATEVANAGDAGSDTDAVSLTPKRLTCYQDISKLLIGQSAISVENMVRNLFISSMQVELDKAAIKGASNGPTGLLATSGIGDVAGGATGLAPTLAHILALIKEVAIDDADIGSLGFLTNPKARWKLQSTAIESGHPERVWKVDVQDMLVGFKAGVTTQVPGDLDKSTSTGVCSAIIFGNWNHLMIAQFGAVDIVVDPLSLAIGNKVRIVLNGFFDSALKQPASFAAMKDALCNS
jgi:HK97 family phage major capsid protein